MKSIKICTRSLLLLTNFYLSIKSYCLTQTFVYCQDITNEENKILLKNDQNENYKVDGNWKIETFENDNLVAIFRVFLLSEGVNKFIEMKEKCKSQNDKNFINLQPYSSTFSIFKISDDKFSRGTLDINYFIKPEHSFRSLILPLKIGSHTFISELELKQFLVRKFLH